jgi:SAM-dependent methyltransferase
MDPKTRFSDRVENYITYRPSYPSEAIKFIVSEFHINSNSIIADIGSGTGILTRLLAKYPSILYAVEPNDEMRHAAEVLLQDEKSVISINGSSESTNLGNNSIDVITAAQAFHWFDIHKTKTEFKRILTENGKVVLLWNRRQTNTEFLVGYDSLLKKYAAEYNEINHRNISIDTLRPFFSDGTVGKKTFHNVQTFDLDGVMGRLLSASYAPLPGDNNYQTITTQLNKLFAIHNINGFVDFNYETELYWGSME